MIEAEQNYDSIENKLSLYGDEISLDQTEQMIWEPWKIKKVESSSNDRNVYQLSINEDSDKELTADEIKDIIHNKYWYNKDDMVLMKNALKFDSWICTSNDVIHIYVEINKKTKIKNQNEEEPDNEVIIDNNEEENKDESNNEDNIEDFEQRSIYADMIENQTSKKKLCYWNRNKPELTLTIDDGNDYDNVEAILNILKEENIKATFFVKWNRLDYEYKGKNTKELWQRAIKEWHQICCHTYNHIYLSGNSDETNLPSSWENSRKDWSSNVKRLLWEKRYKEIEVSEKGKWIDFPKSVSSDVLLETEILMWEAELKNILWKEKWEEYLKKYKRDFPFIRLPWWNWLNREKNIAVLRRLWYLSIYWSDDFLHEKDASGKRPHYTLDEMRVQNWWIPLFHFKWKEEQNYIRQYIDKAKGMGKKFKPLSDVIVPTN